MAAGTALRLFRPAARTAGEQKFAREQEQSHVMFHPQGPTFWELARQALSSTRRGYELLAPKFDYTPFRTPRTVLQEVRPWIGEPSSLDSALDVCCGTGAGMQMLRPLCRRMVVGVDYCGPMLQVAHRNVAEASGSARVALVRGDVLDMPFAPVFDVAVCFGALGHILPRDQERFVGQVASTLRPGGRFVLLTADLPPRLSKRYWLSRGFNAAMHLRNWLSRPPFHMYYLTFLVPEARQRLEAAGFHVETIRGCFSEPFQDAVLVIGTKP